MLLHEIEAKRKKVWVGKSTVWAILAVSFAASLGYWYVLSGVSTAKNVSGFWMLILWLVVAVGAVAELIKKVSLSTFRNKNIWLVSTFVSVITVLGTYQILDSNRQNDLIKQSDAYQQATARKSGALDRASEYAHAASYDLQSLEAEKQKIVEDRNKRKISYASYKSMMTDVEQKLIDKRKYDAAMNTANNTSVQGIAETNVSSNPLLSNAASASGINEQLIKTIFFLLVTLLLEIAAYYIGGETERLENELRYSQAELLDKKNLHTFGFSMAQLLDNKNGVISVQSLNAPDEKQALLNDAPVQSEPKKVQVTKHEESQQKAVSNGNAPKKVQVTRDAVTADTGTNGEASKRYQALKQSIESGETKPTFRAVRAFKYADKGMGQTTAKKYYDQLKNDGLIS